VEWPPDKLGVRSGWSSVRLDLLSFAAGSLAGEQPGTANGPIWLAGTAEARVIPVGAQTDRDTLPALASRPRTPWLARK
jgi:hypothetical protein